MTVCPFASVGGLSRSSSVQRNGPLGLPEPPQSTRQLTTLMTPSLTILRFNYMGHLAHPFPTNFMIRP
jgi:hypothetical protein